MKVNCEAKEAGMCHLKTFGETKVSRRCRSPPTGKEELAQCYLRKILVTDVGSTNCIECDQKTSTPKR